MELDKYKGGDFKYDNSFFEILSQDYRKNAFLVPSLGILFFRKTLQLDKFEGGDFKHDNSLSKVLAQECPNKVFLVPNLGIFVISQNFAI